MGDGSHKKTGMRPPVTVTTGRSTRFALALDYLHPDERVTLETVVRDGAALLTALEGQRDATFTLQTVARPVPRSPERGRLEVHLVVTLVRTGGRPVLKRRVAELADDLLDLFGAPPVRWSFTPVTDPVVLGRVLDPLPATHYAEIVRREEPVGPAWLDRWATAGFTVEPGERRDDGGLWTMWTFGPPATDPERLASVLLAQEDPVCMRVSVTPTVLTADERTAVEHLTATQFDVAEPSPVHAASLRTIEAFLYLRPLFEAQCLVASSAPLSRSLLSAIGHSMSEPPFHGPTGSATLQGGFGVVHRVGDAEHAALAAAYAALRPEPTVAGLAPPPLQRIRRLFGPWEAAHAFRIPISTDDRFPGLPVLDVPDLPAPLRELPREGRLLGSLLAPAAREVRIDPEERFRHAYVVGQTGTGKSTLLLNLAMQDIEAGAGVAVLDPHGDLVEALLARIPDDRIDDVVLVDPADPVAVVGVNVLEAETAVQQAYVVSELCNLFYQLFDPRRTGIVGPRFESMMRQAALLLLANPDQPSSFLDISTPFVDKAVRDHLVAGLTDPIVAEFWKGEFEQTGDFHRSEVLNWFRSKFEVFRTSPLVRRVVGQADSTVSFSEILRGQKILLVNLSKGLLGNYNSALLGSLVFARLWAAILERAAVPAADRPDFFVYIDEFQNMTSESLPEVLSEARKFRVALTIANQFFTQIPEMTRDAVMGNVATRVTFRLGPKDAGPFATWLGAAVDPDDLVTLANYSAFTVISDQGIPLDPCVLTTNPLDGVAAVGRADLVRERSRARWARPVAEIDDDFARRWAAIPGSIAATAWSATPAAGHTRPPRTWIEEWLDARIAVHCGGRTARAALDLLEGFDLAAPPADVAAYFGSRSELRRYVGSIRPRIVDGTLAELRTLGARADRYRIRLTVAGDRALPADVTDHVTRLRAGLEARRAVLATPIAFLPDPARAALDDASFLSVFEVVLYRRAELLGIGLSPEEVDDVAAALRDLGVDLRSDVPLPVAEASWLASVGLDRIPPADFGALQGRVADRVTEELQTHVGDADPAAERTQTRIVDLVAGIGQELADAAPMLVEHLNRAAYHPDR